MQDDTNLGEYAINIIPLFYLSIYILYTDPLPKSFVITQYLPYVP
jgi:hypothetical protein